MLRGQHKSRPRALGTQARVTDQHPSRAPPLMALVTPHRPLRQEGTSAFQCLAPERGALRVPVTLLQHVCELPDLVTMLQVLL